DLHAHGGEAFGQVQVVEVGDLVALGLELGPAGGVVGKLGGDILATHGHGGGAGAGDAGVFALVGLAAGGAVGAGGDLHGGFAFDAVVVGVVVGADEDAGARVAFVQGCGHGLQVAGVE